MTICTEAARDAARDKLLAIAAEWRGHSMPVDVQREFDAQARILDNLETVVAEEAAAAKAAEAERLRASREPPPLPGRFRAHREVNNDTDRALARADIQVIANTYRGQSMPDEAQRVFDDRVMAIDAYDAECAERTANPPPPDPRDSILAAMRERAGNAPPRPATALSYWDAVRQQGQACRRSRIN